uniref:Uncharacterized protein n=1 Tax=Octopus bimaculoides TaxID=37653 RepID=A0A0L8GQD0_OCTBM
MSHSHSRSTDQLKCSVPGNRSQLASDAQLQLCSLTTTSCVLTFISLIFLCVCLCHILWLVSVAILPQTSLQNFYFCASTLKGEPL